MAFGGNLHINKALTNISVKYKNNEYIASKVLKDVPVKKESDLYYVHVRDFRLPDTLRANKAPSNQVTWGVSTSSYVLNEHALSDVITDRDRRNADSPISPDIEATELLTDKIQLRFEKEIADLLFTTGSWSNNMTGSTATSWKYNTTTSAPIQNVLSATGLIIKNSGTKPNTLVLGWDTFEALKENTNVYDRIKYVERAIVTEDLLAALFDVDKVYVGKAIYDAGAEGVGESIISLWGGNALLAYFNPKVSLRAVTAALNLRISEAGNPYKVKKWREEKISGDVIEVSTMFAPKAVATSCAYYFDAITKS